MSKKLSVKAWVIIIACIVLVITLFLTCLITATAKDENRFIYELNADKKSYSIVGIKNAYRGGWFAKETIEVPETHKKLAVTSIKQIRNLQKTKTVILPDGLKEIGASAFYNSSIASIVIPDSVEIIGTSAFENCTSLANVTLPNNLMEISETLFRSCFSLTEITLPNTVTAIGYGAFQYCYGLESFTLPTNLTFIDAEAFSGCTGLVSIELPSKLRTIGDKAFENCFSLIEICNNSNLNIIEGASNNGKVAENAKHVYYDTEESYIVRTDNGDNVFFNDGTTVLFVKHYGNETSITLPDFNGKAYSIHDYAFYNNSTVKEVVMPDTVTEIGWSAFNSCSSLQKVTIGNGVSVINGEAFRACKQLGEINFGSGIKTIGYRAFYECTKLATVNLKDSIQTIDEEAFAWCSQLKNVTIGKNLQEIGKQAFFNCYVFTELHFGGTTAQWETVKLGSQWTWDNNSTKRAPSCEKIICSDGVIETIAD